jgi:acyl-CoA synthetase (AMP-forming)/AMP-acid ligase II
MVDSQAVLVQAMSRLTGPGGEFEIVEEPVTGVPMRVFAQRERALVELLEQSRRYGEDDYLVTAEGRLSFAEHLRAVASVSQTFAEQFGIGKGDRVAILAANAPEWIVAFWAAASLGAITVGYNAWWTEHEVAVAIEHSTPALLVTDSRRGALIGDVDVPVISLELDIPRMMIEHPRAQLPPVNVDEDDPAVIIYTSGTTGRPKGATHSHRNLIATVGYHRLGEALALALGYPADAPPRRYLMSMPLFHIASLHNVAVPRLATGSAAVIYQGAFDAEQMLRLVERERVTNWTVVPTVAHRLVEHGDLSRYDLSALRGFALASAPSSLALQRRVRQAVPAAEAGLVDSYGQTESCTGATVATADELLRFPGTVGGPIATVELEIRDADGAALGEGEEGEVCLRSPYNMLGYWNDPDATAAVYDPDRWLHTGDIGCLRDGRLYLSTRRSDLILRGGENVYPIEIEQVLDEHSAVEESAVIGVDHPDLGQEVFAIVVLADGATADDGELSAYVGERLAYYKVPARWHLSREPLPRNATGKVVRRDLHG